MVNPLNILHLPLPSLLSPSLPPPPPPDIPPFILVGIHISPDSVTPEMNQMDEVYAQATEALGTGDGMILGDLNADCSYLSMRRYLELDLVTSGQFTWLIGNTVDTTTKASVCAYDRLGQGGNVHPYMDVDAKIMIWHL